MSLRELAEGPSRPAECLGAADPSGVSGCAGGGHNAEVKQKRGVWSTPALRWC